MRRRDLLCGLAALPLLAGAAGPREHRIEVAAMRFGPVPAGIRAGDTILWVNRDIVPHTATSRTGGFDVALPARGNARTIVRRAGRFAFACRYHPAMQSMLAVAAP